jgi:hypothetical protein
MGKKLIVSVFMGMLLTIATGVQAVTLTVGSDADTYIPNNDQ